MNEDEVGVQAELVVQSVVFQHEPDPGTVEQIVEQTLDELVAQEERRVDNIPVTGLIETVATVVPACALYGAVSENIPVAVFATLLGSCYFYAADLAIGAYSKDRRDTRTKVVRARYAEGRRFKVGLYSIDRRHLEGVRDDEVAYVSGMAEDLKESLRVMRRRFDEKTRAAFTEAAQNGARESRSLVELQFMGSVARVYATMAAEIIGNMYGCVERTCQGIDKYKHQRVSAVRARWKQRITELDQAHQREIDAIDAREQQELRSYRLEWGLQAYAESPGYIRDTVGYVAVFGALGAQVEKPVVGALAGVAYGLYRTVLDAGRKKWRIKKAIEKVKASM